VSSCIPALESKLSITKTPDRVPILALMLFKKASAQHLPVQRGHCFRTSDSCQAWSLADAPTQSFTAETEATLVPRLGSAEIKSCTNESSASWLCDETRNRQLQHLTVTPASLDRITAAANQVADATESKDTEEQRQLLA